MSTLETMRLFCDGQMSMHDLRALMLSMGHGSDEIAEAFVSLSSTGSIRVGRYQRDEYQAELYLSA